MLFRWNFKPIPFSIFLRGRRWYPVRYLSYQGTYIYLNCLDILFESAYESLINKTSSEYESLINKTSRTLQTVQRLYSKMVFISFILFFSLLRIKALLQTFVTKYFSAYTEIQVPQNDTCHIYPLLILDFFYYTSGLVN